MSRAVTLNGVKATIIFHGINWELVIESGDNTATIEGSIDIKCAAPVAEPVAEPVAAPVAEPVAAPTPVKAVEDKEVKDKEVNQHIRSLIDTVHDSIGKTEKAKSFKNMYDYLTNNGLDYVKMNPGLKDVTIKKAYEFKTEAGEFSEMVTSIDGFLTLIGAPLYPVRIEPSTCCDQEEEQKQPWRVFDSPYWDNDYKKDKEEKDKEARSTMMQTLFKKEGLDFDNTTMDMYYEWEKTAPRWNRHKKMMGFIAHIRK